jgi:hypothetical protein
VVRRSNEGEAQRRRWTFYEAITFHWKLTPASQGEQRIASDSPFCPFRYILNLVYPFLFHLIPKGGTSCL